MQPYQTGQNHLNQRGLHTSEMCASSVLRAPDIIQVNSATWVRDYDFNKKYILEGWKSS